MKIIISKIPGVFPSGYTEQFYFENRPVKVGLDSFFIETAKKVQIKDDLNYDKRKIQSVLYDKYTCKFITTESVAVDLINFAKEAKIVYDTSEEHLIKLIEAPTFEKLGSSEFREYTLIYRNLYSKQIINHLVYSAINTDYHILLKYKNGTKYTQLYPEFNISEWENSTNKDNYSNLINSENNYKTITATFYIEDSNLQDFIKDLNYKNIRAGIKSAETAETYMQIGETKYIPLELLIVDVEDTEMEGIRPVKITLKYEQILNYPFA